MDLITNYLSAGIILTLFTSQLSGQPAERVPKVDPNHYLPSDNPCYDERGVAQRCVPDFINAAFNLEVEVTNTCGERQQTAFCVQTSRMGIKKVCDICDARVSAFSHPSSYLTDFNNPKNETWWQSETMLEGIQYPKRVNLTLRLGKAFDITYVRLKFVSPRPESFRIFKKGHSDEDWVPWAYYSGSCRSTYKLPEKAPILPGNEAVAQCTREFSDISPLTEGNIAFPTLEGRPSAENFEESEILQDWVTATEIRIVLDRMNTFGDEIFGDSRVLRSYYYAISDFAVGGRCKCNGHASQCVKSTGEGEQQLVCDCKHHTTGVDCQQCEPFYVDRPWRPATSTEANECLQCQCNRLATRCFFDQSLYDETGHGGHCLDCAENTRGPHCKECAENYWRQPNNRGCVPCQCNTLGSVSEQCDASGQCKCKPGVSGQYCDHCLNGFYDFSASGCQDCHCDVSGSYNNTPRCQPTNGECACKPNVEGQRCDKCKPSFFNLALENVFGCTPCFCYGHSSVCSSADGYFLSNISSLFLEDVEQWTVGSETRPEDVQWAQIDHAAAASQTDVYPIYFFAPTKYLGDQRFIYNQDIIFTLRVQQKNPSPSKKDIVIVGANGHELFLPIFSQSNVLPSAIEHTYRFRIHDNPHYQWTPSLREIDFISVLSNISAIKIRGTYSKGDVSFLSNFHIGSASTTPDESSDAVKLAKWVETCKCSKGFVGQFCESCSHGYKRAYKFGGPLTKCIKCDCHGHSESCDAESGVCICQHNTAGDTCERCARGYYGDALNGTETDCLKCDCPDNGPCVLLQDGQTICTECPEGYSGRKCDSCADEYFGQPLESVKCKKCDCNSNIDVNSIGNCDSVTGECNKCIFHTTGFNCEKCVIGYWGNALAKIKGDCKACNCYVPGTIRPAVDYNLLECQQSDGQCNCQPNVIGLQCDNCQIGFFNLTSGNGCEECNCNALGSINSTCDVNTGECHCKPGVVGRRCDQCALRHFGFSAEGCRFCDCDVFGSETPDCDVRTGQCLCKDNVEGRRCNQCSENRYGLQRGCLACDDCYTLIQARKNLVNESISSLKDNLSEIINNPVPVNDVEFGGKVSNVREQVQELYNKANQKLDGDDTKMQLQVSELKNQFDTADNLLNYVDIQLNKVDEKSLLVEMELQRLNMDKNNIQNELTSAITYVESEGGRQLTKAQQVADRYGDKSQQLSDLADQAKQLSDKQEAHKKEIKALAEKARNISKEALSEANEAIFGATSTSQQISSLYNQITDFKRQLNKTKDLANEQSVETAKVYEDSVKTVSNVESIKPPPINSDELKQNAQTVKEQTAASLKSVQEEVLESEKILHVAQQATAEALRQFHNVQLKQLEADHLLKDIEFFFNRSTEAFDLATKIWNEAKDSHDALLDFNNKVQQNKQEALEELNNLPEIKKELNEAELTTKKAEEAVGDARQDAFKAKKIADEAKLKSDNLIQESNELIVTSEKIKDDVVNQKISVDNLVSSINLMESTTTDFKNQAFSDSERSQKVLRKATIAESNAKNLQEQLTKADKNLFDALNQLNAQENVSDNQLSELERLLEESEKRYDKSKSEGQLKEKIRRAEEEAAREKRQIDALNKDLENLRSIRDSLPTKCFNLVNLEQEGQKRR